MNCQDVQKFAFTYLDCEFDGRERGEFETHLRMCAPCAAAVERDAMFRDMVRHHLDTPPPPAALKQKVHACLEREQQRRASRNFTAPLVLAACGALIVVAWRMLPTGETVVSAVAVVPPADAANGESLLPARGVVPAIAVAGMAGRRGRPSTGATTPAPFGVARNAPDKDAVALASAVADRRTTERAERIRAEALAALEANLARQHAIGRGGERVSLASTGSFDAGEVLRGSLRPDALRDRSPFGAVRSDESLRAMARIHAAGLPPEIGGSAVRIQRYLSVRVPGIGPLPLTEGSGVNLLGARIGMIGSQPVVAYSYVAYGVALTVISRAKAANSQEDPEIEAVSPDARVESGVLLDRRAGLSLLHVVTSDRVLTLVSELGAPALLQLAPHSTWL